LATFFFSAILNAQTINIEEGKLYMMHMKNGNKVKARVTFITKQQISCNLNDGPYPAIYQKSDISRFEQIKYPSTGSIGLGMGVPYGGIGINGEIAIYKYFSLSGGIGSTGIAGSGYSAGGKVYFTSAESKWRPRISADYGINSAISVTGITEISEKFEGITLGIGFLHTLGENRRSGFDFDVLYLATCGNFYSRWDEIKKSFSNISEPYLGRVKISIGYRIMF
jgi:hypothetical protein